jgi:hypothetical protein
VSEDDGISLDAIIDAVVNSDAFFSRVIEIIVTWVVNNVFLDPAATIIGIFEWAFASLLGVFDSAVRGALEPAGSAVWDAFLGPDGVITALQETAVDAATSAGIASPVAAGVVNLLLALLVIGVIYLFLRAVAGYLTGGVAA